MAAKVVQFALERGLIVRALPHDVVSICPPLIVASLRMRHSSVFSHEEAGVSISLNTLINEVLWTATEVSAADVNEIFDRLEGALSDALAALESAP